MATKEKVLEMLITQGADEAVSGEKLAADCGVSRAAIWKAVNALRSEGYEIEGTPNGGYFLSDKDIMTPQLFQKALAEKFPELSECHTEVFKVIDSTNTYAKRLLAECGELRRAGGASLTEAGKKYHRSIIVAESQTAGRGRLGRSFVSPEKTGIYLSIIYAPEGGITNPARLTACIAVAICRALRKLYGIEAQIKWINDIFYKGKKICGILAEGVANFESGIIESAVVGIGINIRENQEAFGQELSKTAGAIEGCEKKASVSRSSLAAEIAGQVLKIYEEDKKNHKTVIDEYRQLSFLLGQTLTVYPLIGDDKSAYLARALEIDDDARLVVEVLPGDEEEWAASLAREGPAAELKENGHSREIRILNSGEVSLHSSEVRAG